MRHCLRGENFQRGEIHRETDVRERLRRRARDVVSDHVWATPSLCSVTINAEKDSTSSKSTVDVGVYSQKPTKILLAPVDGLAGGPLAAVVRGLRAARFYF